MSDVHAVRRTLARHGWQPDTVLPLGAGLDHAAYEVDGELVVRVAAADDGAGQVVREQVTGVIDWSDAAVTDAARDLGLLYRDLGPAALDAALLAYGELEEEARQRAEFHARCGALEDLAFGVESGRTAYLTKTLRSLVWLFPPRPDH